MEGSDTETLREGMLTLIGELQATQAELSANSLITTALLQHHATGADLRDLLLQTVDPKWPSISPNPERIRKAQERIRQQLVGLGLLEDPEG